MLAYKNIREEMQEEKVVAVYKRIFCCCNNFKSIHGNKLNFDIDVYNNNNINIIILYLLMKQAKDHCHKKNSGRCL